MSSLDSLTTLAWGGKIPITFILAPGDVAQLHPPAPRYIMASRMSYLGVVAEKAIAHFRLAVAPTGGGSENIWFEAAGIPLKWQLPIGVLIDAVRSSTAATLLLPLPFQIVIHFHDFPSDKILACSGTKAARWSYINTLKQSACLRFGSAKKVLTGLSATQQQQMWDAINNGNYTNFSTCNIELHGQHCNSKEPVQRRSIRLIAIAGGNGTEEKNETEGNLRIRNVLYPYDETNIDVIKGSDVNVNVDVNVDGNEDGNEDGNKDGNKEEAEGEIEGVQGETKQDDGTNHIEQYVSIGTFLGIKNQDEQDGKIMIHGVEIPLDSNIVELHESMASADNCLYIVLSGTFVKLL